MIIFFLGCLCRGFSELVAFHHDESRFSARVRPTSFFGSKMDLRKYKRYGKHSTICESRPTKGLYGWYHKRFKLRYKECFLFSATALVSVTDSFHLSNIIFRLSMILAVCFADWYPMEPVKFVITMAEYMLIYVTGYYITYYGLRK
jgi:hypothetical protein